jgi:sugar lactone lactonase YvrE
MNKPMRFAPPLVALSLLASLALLAGDTRTWSQGEYADFEKSNVKNISLRSDGMVSLAPRSSELFDTASPYLWALARDSKGNLYTGGGASAKLFVIPPGGKGKLLADLTDALEVHAVAVDSKDRVYFATSPDGKVYRMAANGKPEVFYDPKAKYIWALIFDKKDDLFVATGDHGEIHRVTPDGKGQVFYHSDETHVRSLVFDANGNLIAGTDPGGLVLRISPQGTGFVLYQLSKREVTAVAVARDGAIYAAAVGNKLPGVATSPLPSAPAPAPAASATVTAPGAQPPPAARPNTPPPSNATAPGVPGGSEVYRIEPDGNPRRVWSNAQEVVYAIAFDAAGRPILAAGNRGNLYRIESPTVSTALLSVPVAQVTALVSSADGRLYAATGNVGKVYEIGPGFEPEGTLESEVFDSAMYSQWGRLTFDAHLNGGRVSVVTRSGNLDQPQKDWSAWSQPISASKGARVESPGARFVQWKATLTVSSGGQSPELESVDLAYLPKNIEPHVDLIEITPPNYKFPPPSLSLFGLTQQQTLSLPPLGRRTPSSPPPAPSDTPATITPSMQLVKGYIGARWQAGDPNGDSLLYTVEIRGVNETEWKLLKDKLVDKYYSWDSTAFPDGDYRLRITASDAPSNPPSEALTARMESVTFTIDNTPPRITGMSAVASGRKLLVRWHAADALNNIEKAEYSLDGGDWLVAAPVTRLSDSMDLDYELTLDAPPGEHTIAVRVYDDYDNQATDKAVVK